MPAPLQPAAATRTETTSQQSTSGSPLVGSAIPDLVLKDERDGNVALRQVVEKRGAVFFFFSKVGDSQFVLGAVADTPGCLRQATAFQETWKTFNSADYQVFGVSGDTPTVHSRWKHQQGFIFNLLTDEGFRFAGALGLTTADEKGNKIGSKRSHVVVEPGGKIKDVKMDVKPEESAESALGVAVKKIERVI
ncbi:peroxiredoxin [Spizellomyces sp. 'palustris']|nr:peroxiredoxin [Spizellomyces sp. 'palustris']